MDGDSICQIALIYSAGIKRKKEKDAAIRSEAGGHWAKHERCRHESMSSPYVAITRTS